MTMFNTRNCLGIYIEKEKFDPCRFIPNHSTTIIEIRKPFESSLKCLFTRTVDTRRHFNFDLTSYEVVSTLKRRCVSTGVPQKNKAHC